MTEKRFTIKPQDDYFGITDNNTADKMNVINGIRTEIEAKWLCDLMNELNDELGKLTILYSAKCKTEETLIREGERLEKENKELKIKNDLLSDELEQAKAVINKEWSEYLKKKME